MTSADSLYQACGERFAAYPLAVEAVDSVCSMVLLHQDGGEASFFILASERDAGRPSYSVRRWRSSDGTRIDPGADTATPRVFADAILCGVPVPRHGSLMGWRDDEGTITALIAFYAEYTPQSPVPSWAPMPRADTPETRWPPFADESLLGPWLWKYYRAGRLVSLDGLIAANPRMVFWADTAAVLGSNCCVVAGDIGDPAGPALQRGRYVYYQALRAGKPVPSLGSLLAGAKIDLAPRLRPDHNDNRPQPVD